MLIFSSSIKGCTHLRSTSQHKLGESAMELYRLFGRDVSLERLSPKIRAWITHPHLIDLKIRRGEDSNLR